MQLHTHFYSLSLHSEIRDYVTHGLLLCSPIVQQEPDYIRVIPVGNDKFLKVNNSALEKAVDRVATVSAERSRSVKMTIDDDKLVLTVNHAETGHGLEEVEGQYDAEPLEIGFNARYLLDVSQQIDGEEVIFEFNDPASPALVKDPADPASRYVLMPLRV